MDTRIGIPGLEYISRIGSGGFADVFLCRQISLDRLVAVKIVRPGSSENGEEAASTVFQEATYAARSQHPSIMGVLNVGTTAEGLAYILMPYYRNGNLETRLHYGPLPYQEVLQMGVHLAGAVATAHSNKVLHCDIKPQNVLFDDFDRPVLCDFGISSTFDDRFHTSVGLTLTWAAPEVIRGERPNLASDVYSLAATLWSALLGFKPFCRNKDERISEPEHIRRIMAGERTPLPNGVPGVVTKVLTKAMSEPRTRTKSALQFGQELQQLQLALGLEPTTLEAPVEDSKHKPLADLSPSGIPPAPLTPKLPAAMPVVVVPASKCVDEVKLNHQSERPLDESRTIPKEPLHPETADKEKKKISRRVVSIAAAIVLTALGLIAWISSTPGMSILPEVKESPQPTQASLARPLPGECLDTYSLELYHSYPGPEWNPQRVPCSSQRARVKIAERCDGDDHYCFKFQYSNGDTGYFQAIPHLNDSFWGVVYKHNQATRGFPCLLTEKSNKTIPEWLKESELAKRSDVDVTLFQITSISNSKIDCGKDTTWLEKDSAGQEIHMCTSQETVS